MNELRLSIRRLLKRPWASVASVLALGCSIGAVAATWSLLSAVVLRPLSVPNADRIVVLDTTVIYPRFAAIRDSGTFDAVAGSGGWTIRGTIDGESRTLRAQFVSANFFDTVGVRLAMGRIFSADDDQRGRPPTAILSNRLWRDVFGGDRSVTERTIEVETQTLRIAGVLERGFSGLDLANPADLYLPINTAGDVIRGQNLFADPDRRNSPVSWITALGRLRSGATADAAAAQLSQVLAGARQDTVALIPLQTATIPAAVRPALATFARLLVIAVALLLLVGCVTVGLLLLIRTEARRGEFATCLALGASPVRLARGVLLDGGILVATGALLSLPAAGWCFAALSAAELPGGVSVAALDLRLDLRTVGAATAASGMVTIAIALVAAWFGLSTQTGGALRSRAGATPRLQGRRVRAALIISQVAGTLVLVAGAGVFSRSLYAALQVNPGFDTTRLLTSWVSLPSHRFPLERHELATAIFASLRERLNSNPAIQSASFFHTPVAMGGQLVINGMPRRFPTAVGATAVDERYFSTVGLRLLRGRDFSAIDDDRAPLVTIVSESFGRMLSNGGNPLGSRIQAFYTKAGMPFPLIEVVGVVPDVITDVARLEPLVMYMPLAQESSPGWSRQLVLRPTSSLTDAARETLATIKAIDPTLTPAANTTPLLTVDQQVLAGMAPQRLGFVVLSALGGIALVLTVLGTYVLAEAMAVARTREMGVRAALGATERQVALIVVSETVRLVGAGLAAGLFLTWLAGGTVRAFLFRVEPLDSLTLVSVAGTILALSLIVTLRPALAVARVDLTRLMRDE